MREFLKLNGSKLVFAFVFISLLSAGITLALLFITGMFRNNSVQENLIALLLSAFFWPCFILFIAYLSYISRQNSRNKMLKSAPFNQISGLGFSNYDLHADDKWQFTELVPHVIWKGYTILLIGERSFSTNRMKFLALVENSRMDENRFMELKSLFAAKQMAFDFGGIALYIPGNYSGIDLRTALDDMIALLESEHFEPASKRLM